MPSIYEQLAIDSEDFEFQLDTVRDFLSKVHPFLTDDTRRDACVEIRPILREGKSYKHSKSLTLWSLDDTSITYLKEFLLRLNKVPACIFYSVFSFDNSRFKRIRKSNSLFTNEIALDFDNIGEKEQAEFDKRLSGVGIHPMWVFTGHGYHAHILLSEDVYEPDILEKFIHLFKEKGFPVDEACKDPARLMRIPFTFNCKAFADEESEEKEKPRMCEVKRFSDYRHSVQELYLKLNMLPSSSLCPEKEKINLKDEKKGQKKSIQPAVSEPDRIELKKISYPHIRKYTIPEPVCKMLAQTPKGYRNSVLGFLIGYFNRTLYMSKEQIQEILLIWGSEACMPEMNEHELRNDINRIYHNYGGLPYDSKLAKKFGIIPFNNDLVLSKKDVAIPNDFFYDFENLSGPLVRMYIGIKLLEHTKGATTQEGIAKLLKISKRAVRTTLNELVKTGHCYMRKGNAKLKEPNTYHTNHLYNKANGHSVFTYNDLKCYITELFDDRKRGNNELKLYLYMQHKFRSGEIFMSQSTFGEYLNLKQNSVCEIVKRLVEKGFLYVEKKQHELQPQFTKCYYTLLR